MFVIGNHMSLVIGGSFRRSIIAARLPNNSVEVLHFMRGFFTLDVAPVYLVSATF